MGELMICTATGKRIYPSYQTARRAALRFKQRPLSRFKKKELVLQAYYCAHCEQFHIGHRKHEDGLPKRTKPRWRS